MFFVGLAFLPNIGSGQDDLALEPEGKDILDTIVIPEIHFVDTEFTSALDFLEGRAREIQSKAGQDPQPLNLVVLAEERLQEDTVFLQLSQVPLRTALTTTAEMVGAHITRRPELILISRGGIPNVVERLPGHEALEEELKSIRLSKLELQDAMLRDVLDFLRERSKELDRNDDLREGVNLVLKQPQPVRITLNLEDVSLFSALEAAALASGYQMQIREHLVVFDLRR